MSKHKMPITPQLLNNSSASMYEYDYCKDNYDKIYYSTGDLELRKDLLEHNPITIRANYGDIENEFDIEHKQLIERLEYMICQHLSLYIGQTVTKINSLHPVGDKPPWINYMKPGDYHAKHNHDGIFSFVWYLDMPQEVQEEWKNTSSRTGTRGCIEFSSQIVANQNMIFMPRTNDLFLFHSNHNHTVYPYYSENTRISLSGNVYEYE